MPNFRYQSLTTSGEQRSGVVSADSRADAVRQLLNRGETATTIEPDQPGKRKAAAAVKRSAGAVTSADPLSALTFRLRSGRPSLSQGEMASFIRELATAVEAGLPLMQALRTVRKQASGKGMPVILDHLIDRVEQGDPLYRAAREYGPPFNDMVIGMLRAADASGKMSDVMHQLADLLERSVELKRELWGATLYPIIVATLIIASAVILVTVLVPTLITPLASEMDASMPWPTLVVMNIAEFLSAWWIAVIIAIGLILIAVRIWLNMPGNRLIVDRLLLRVPVLGPLLRDVAVARFTRTLGTLTSAGLPILDGLRITQDTLGNKALIRAIDDVKEKVTGGKSLAEPLERSGLFPPLLIQVVHLGERSGRLESMLLHAATAFDRNVNTSLNLFSKALPPFLLIIMAAMGGFILAAILLPLLELQSMVGG